MNRQKISGLIDTAIRQPDADNQYMAARDLCEELYNFYSKQNLEEQNEELLQNVFDVFLQHLHSDYKDLQGNAIQCLSKLMNVIQPPLIKYVAEKIRQKLVSEKPERRDNYVICLISMIQQVNVQFHEITEITPKLVEEIGRLKKKIEQLRAQKQIGWYEEIQGATSLQSELLRILSNLLTKWSEYYLANPKFRSEATQLSLMLFENILNEDDGSIRKHSCICLGSVGQCFQREQLNKLIKETFLNKLTENVHKFDTSGFQKNLFLTQSMNYLAKSSGNKFDKENIAALTSLIFKQIDERDSIDIDYVNQYSEVLELQLLTLGYLFQSNQNEMMKFQKLSNNVYLDFLITQLNILCIQSILIQWELLLMIWVKNIAWMRNIIWKIVNSKNEYIYYSADDKSWRVRRCSIQLLQTMLQNSQTLYKEIIGNCFRESNEEDSSPILLRLGEKNDEIKQKQQLKYQFKINCDQFANYVYLKFNE